MSDSDKKFHKNTTNIIKDNNNNDTDIQNDQQLQNGVESDAPQEVNQHSETISKVESLALEENKNSSESTNKKTNNSNNKTVENKTLTISTKNLSNNTAIPISPNTLANNNGQTTMRYISYIPAPTTITTQAFTTQPPPQQHLQMELNVTQNTASISPQQWATNKDGQLQAVPTTAYIPSSYQINQYDPQYTTYQNIAYSNYSNYSNMVPVEYSYGHTPPINNEHPHHNSNVARGGGQYENGLGMNTYIQYIPNDHQQHSYAEANAYQVSSNTYAPYKNVNQTSRTFNPHKHNKYTNDSNSVKSSSNNNNKNSNKNSTNVEEINGTSKQSHKWSDIVSGKNNENSTDNPNNENNKHTQSSTTSVEMNKENYDQENDSNENFNYYNYNDGYANKKIHSKQHNNTQKSVYSNLNVDSNGYVNSNGKYHGKRQTEFFTGYTSINTNYGYNQYGFDVNYQDPQYYNPQYQAAISNVNLIGTDFSNLNILSPSPLYSNSYNKSFLSYPFKSNKNFENKKFRLVNKSSKSPSDISSNNNNLVEKYNPLNFLYNGELENENSSRFFVIKSYSKEDVIHSIKNNIWCSTENGNSKLDEAFKQTINQKHMSIYLFFSVNGSGQFCGMAEMVSSVDYKSSSQLWTQNKWKGKFDVKWIFVKDVPNMILRHIHLPNNENKSVTNSRDTQEILFDQAIPVLDVFRNYEHETTILDENVSDSFTPITYFNRKDFEYKKSWQDSSKEKFAPSSFTSQFKTSTGEPTIKKILTKGDKVKNLSGKPEENNLEKNDS